MLISDRLIYLALHKTGCSHVLKLLESTTGLNGVVIGKHNTINEVSAERLGDFKNKIKAGNIRNPWDWYVSLWAFGCMKKGGLYDHLVTNNFLKSIKNPKSLFAAKKNWKEVYADAENISLFQKWLKMVLVTDRNDIPEFKKNNPHDFIGLLSFRYMQLYTTDFKSANSVITGYDDLYTFDKKNNFLNMFIRNEYLESDFIELMKKIEIPETSYSALLQAPKTNASQRKSYHQYYDTELVELVHAKEKLIIDKHGYIF